MGRGQPQELELPVDPDRADLSSGVGPARRPRSRRVLLAIALAGAAGAVARDGLDRLFSVPAGSFDWATFTINVSGAFAIGLVLVVLAERFAKARLARPVLATGFLGGYTTFSTYVVGADQLVRLHEAGLFVVYLLATVFAGLAAVTVGLLLGRALCRPAGRRWR